MSAPNETPPVELKVKRWRLAKYDGDPPKPGEHKEPVEIIEGGDDIPTRVIFRKEASDGPD